MYEHGKPDESAQRVLYLTGTATNSVPPGAT